MKKNFIYALIACFTLSLAACSTDPEDATMCTGRMKTPI